VYRFLTYFFVATVNDAATKSAGLRQITEITPKFAFFALNTPL
jgi:hypothetical protein